MPEDTRTVPIARNTVHPANFNTEIELPYQLRTDDFRSALQDVYDFFHDVNEHLVSKGLQRLDDILRPAIMSGVLSDMLTSSLAQEPQRSMRMGSRNCVRVGFTRLDGHVGSVGRKLGNRVNSHQEIVSISLYSDAVVPNCVTCRQRRP